MRTLNVDNLINKKFNQLTVLKFIGYKKQKNGKNRSYFNCLCDCGTSFELPSQKINITKSCGCLKHNKKFKKRNLIGNKYGRLIVIKENGYNVVGKNHIKRKLWYCKCFCGTFLNVIEHSLLNGNTKSCGCIRSESQQKYKFRNLTNKKFGRWHVIEFSKRVKGTIFWKCKCACGKISLVRGNNLVTGGSLSCGCLRLEKITIHGLSNNITKLRKYLWKKDPSRKLRHIISCAINKILKGRKNGSCFKYLPYTAKELKIHLESLFEPWMNWNNYGGTMKDKRKTWHIDHKIPQTKFNYSSMNDIDFLKCWELTNLQPMEKIKNVKKGNKII